MKRHQYALTVTDVINVGGTLVFGIMLYLVLMGAALLSTFTHVLPECRTTLGLQKDIIMGQNGVPYSPATLAQAHDCLAK